VLRRACSNCERAGGAAEGNAAERKSHGRHRRPLERIRTYNFPQNRLTDHRIGLTVHNAIMNGELDEVVEAILTHRREEALAATRKE
jgi:peptide chain release factor 1